MRQSTSSVNPTIPGAIYGPNITAGIPVFFIYKNGRTYFIILLCDGGKYGMSDLTLAEYKSVPLTEIQYHRGTFTKQIEPFAISGIHTGTDVVTTALTHPFLNADLVRFGVTDGVLPPELSKDLKYQISDKTATTFKVKDEAGVAYIDFSTAGTGDLIVWKADAGWDDPEQGRPTWCPEFDSTFSNIAYVEGRLSAAHSPIPGPNAAATQPDWDKFRFAFDGRRLMDYDDEGTELGVINGDDAPEIAKLSLTPLHILDNYLVNYKGKASRIDFPSWKDLRDKAAVEIWQKVKTDETGSVHGAVGRYFSDIQFGELTGALMVARIDLELNFNFGTTVPAPGMPITNYSIRWNFQQTFEFTEAYTLKFDHDDSVKVWIDGTMVLDAPTNGVHTVVFSAIADQVYQVQIDFTQETSVAKMIYKWSSASQAEEVVPSDFLFPIDQAVLRYGQNGMAFPSPTEASEVHERMMERLPGWDWTDDNGKIVFLPPDRPIAFIFKFDRIDDDSIANFVYGSFAKKRRPLFDRRNFIIGKGRDALLTGYPVFYRQRDRDELRKLTNGEPSNDPAAELGVCTPSLAERMLEMEMVIKSDPTHTFNIGGVRGSSKLRKNQLITVFYYDLDLNYVADAVGIVTFHGWGNRNSLNQFTALPIVTPLITDEEVGEPNVDLSIIDPG